MKIRPISQKNNKHITANTDKNMIAQSTVIKGMPTINNFIPLARTVESSFSCLKAESLPDATPLIDSTAGKADLIVISSEQQFTR